MSGFSCFTVAEGALRTWFGVREGKRGPTDQVGTFKIGPTVGGNKLSTGEGFLTAGLLVKGDEVANLVGSSSTRKGVEWPLLLRENADPSQPRSRGFGVRLPAPQTDRHRMAGRWRSKTPSLILSLIHI